MQSERRLKAIQTDGGPLLVLDSQLLEYWHGVPDDYFDNIAPVEDTSMVPSDYDRACEVNDYVGCMTVGPGQGLVLNDEPLITTWWSIPRARSGMFVRLHWAPDEDAVLAALREIS